MRFALVLCWIAACAAAIAACGSGRHGDGAFHPGSHEPLPQIPALGGPVLASPRVITVTFPGYAYASEVQSFGDWITHSSWLASVGSDYGVTLGTSLAPVVLASDLAPATASDAQSQSLLTSRINDGTLPAPDPNTLYILYYPVSTIVSDFSGLPNCNGPLGGYHWEMPLGTAHVAYAVVPACTADAQTLGYIQAAASHELIEAATDPNPLTGPAWALTTASSPWTIFDGEVADLCEGVSYFQDSGFFAQRSWSNSAAAAGGDPCVPAPPRPYYNSSTTPATVLHVPHGTSTTLTLRGWSTAPTPDWKLHPISLFGDFQPGITVGAAALNNGRTTSMKITVPASAAPGATAVILLSSEHDASSYDLNYWPIVVTAQ